jgi:hypothetical protein
MALIANLFRLVISEYTIHGGYREQLEEDAVGLKQKTG